MNFLPPELDKKYKKEYNSAIVFNTGRNGKLYG